MRVIALRNYWLGKSALVLSAVTIRAVPSVQCLPDVALAGDGVETSGDGDYAVNLTPSGRAVRWPNGRSVEVAACHTHSPEQRTAYPKV
jgi:hypothetical protein